MLFQVNDQTEIEGFECMAIPGSHFHPLVEVTTHIPLLHADLGVREQGEAGEDDLIINRHFIATKIEAILQLIESDQVESVSIYLHEKNDENGREINLVREIYKSKTTAIEPTYFYHLDNGKEVRDFFPLSGKTTGKKTCIYRHGKGLLAVDGNDNKNNQT